VVKQRASNRIRLLEDPMKPIETRVKKLQNEGKRIISLVSGDPINAGGFTPPEHVVRSLVMAAQDKKNYGYSGYLPWGLELKRAIADRQKKDHGIFYPPDRIVLTYGGTNAIDLLYFSLFDPKDELLVPEPTYHLFVFLTQCYRTKFVTCRSDETNDWLPDIDDLRTKISEKTKCIILVNPNNPTGAVYNEKILREFVNIAGEHDLVIISDEIYDMTTFDGVKAISIASVAKDVPCIILNALTKSYLVPAFRQGFICFHDPEEKINELVEKTNTFASKMLPMSALIQKASIDVLKGPTEFRKDLLKKLEKRRDYAWKRLNEIDGLTCVKPKGSYFAFPKVDGIGRIWKSDKDFLLSLLEEEGIVLRLGSMFGEKYGVEHFRVSFLFPINTMREAYDKLESFMKRHVS